MRNKILFIVLIMAAVLACGFGLAGGYLTSATDSQTADTINTTTANDTSDIFGIGANGDDKEYVLEYKQNSIFGVVKIVGPSRTSLRVIYTTADSSLSVETKVVPGNGWAKCNLIPIGAQTTTVDKVSLTLKTGTGIVSIRKAD